MPTALLGGPLVHPQSFHSVNGTQRASWGGLRAGGYGLGAAGCRRDSVTATDALDRHPSSGFSAARGMVLPQIRPGTLPTVGGLCAGSCRTPRPPRWGRRAPGIQPLAPISSCALSTFHGSLLRLQQRPGLKQVFACPRLALEDILVAWFFSQLLR